MCSLNAHVGELFQEKTIKGLKCCMSACVENKERFRIIIVLKKYFFLNQAVTLLQHFHKTSYG